MTPDKLKFRTLYLGTKMISSEDMVKENKLASFFSCYVDDPEVIMMYAGMDDKNGKLIYEGDIVTLVEAKRKYTVEYIEGTFKLVHADPKLNRMVWGSVYRVSELNFTIEVLGNIHENPEMLNF